MQSNAQDLKSALRDVLESRGVMGDLRAKMRTEVFRALDDEGSAKPELCRENLLLNELIREYLTFNDYKYTSSVLLTESGQPQEPLERSFLLKELNLHPDTDDKVPLLYHILTMMMRTPPELHHRAEGDKPSSSHSTSAPQVTVRNKCTIEEPSISNSSC